MKVLFAFALLGSVWAVCDQRSECSPGFLQQQPQQTMNMNPAAWTNALSSAVFQSIDQVMERVLNQLYGEEEGENLMTQLRTCQSQRGSQLLGIGARMSLLATQFLTLCNLQNPDQQADRLFTQVLHIIGPMMAPCELDRDIAADLVVAQWAALSTARQANETAFLNATQVGLNMTGALSLTERLYNFTDSLVANFSNSLQSLADRGLLDENQVPVIIDLLQTTMTQSEQIYSDLLTNIGSDPTTALSTAQTETDALISSLEDGLNSLQVPQADIQSLTGTLQSLTSEVDTAISTLMNDPTATSSAESSLTGLTSQLGSVGQETAQIMVSIVTQNVDEFCASRSSSSTNST